MKTIKTVFHSVVSPYTKRFPVSQHFRHATVLKGCCPLCKLPLTLTKMSKYQDFLILEAHWIRSKNMEDVNKKVFVKDKGAIF